LIIQGLGNKENIKVVTNCFSRLRVQLVDTTKINEEILNQTECSGIVKTKDGVQIIYGLSVPKIKIAVNKKLNLDNSEE
jgi:PTS system arbutin-like IIC component